MNKPIFVKCKTTGGHWAFKTEKASKPFVNKMAECISISLNNSDIVVDIGAYVGEYSIWVVNNGEKQVLSYEPTPRTFDVLRMNAKPRMKLFNLAVVG